VISQIPPTLINAAIDLVVPGPGLDLAVTLFLADVGARVPFGWIGQLTEAIGDALGSPAGADVVLFPTSWEFDLPGIGHASVPTNAEYYLGPLLEFRTIFGIAICLLFLYTLRDAFLGAVRRG
jgi:hypothetical protein